MPTTKTGRLNLRCSPAALATLREAAALQDQDLTSFVLGAALDRSRAVLSQNRALCAQGHDALDSEPSAWTATAPAPGTIGSDAGADAGSNQAHPPVHVEADLDAEPVLADLIPNFRRTQKAYFETLGIM